MKPAEEALDELCLNISEMYFKDEVLVYKLIGKKKIQQIYSGENISSSGFKKGEFEFGESVKEILSIIQVIIATYFAVKKIVNEIKTGLTKKDKNDFDLKWQEELEKNGIEPIKASKIVKQFKYDFIKVVAANETN